MVTEQNKTLEVLRTAIQMEEDGKQYYLDMFRDCGNEMGRKLFQSLAAEEDVHKSKFEEIFKAISHKHAWPVTDFKPDGGQRLRTIFSVTLPEKAIDIKACSSELNAVQIALGKEGRSFDYYNDAAKKAAFPLEKLFYETLAAEEKEHHLILLDYFEYLKNPAGWFVMKERHSLDGG